MFSGIVETTTRLRSRRAEGSNVVFTFACPGDWNLRIDQSVAHNGVCLTVDGLANGVYTVTAMDETLKRTNLGGIHEGDRVNLERSMTLGARLDGHIVQGHVDTVATLTAVRDCDGSTELTFAWHPQPGDSEKGYAIVEKGSVALNGVSLTAYAVGGGTFKVSLIPYTSENTNLGAIRVGDKVNVEFDIIGKYVARLFPGTHSDEA